MLNKDFLCSDGSAGGVQVTLKRKAKGPLFDLEVSVSEQEMEAFISETRTDTTIDTTIDTSIPAFNTPKIAVNRTSKTMVNKFQTTVNELERLFFLAKLSSLANATVKYYQRSNKKLKKFMAMNFTKTVKDYADLLEALWEEYPDASPDEIEERLGGMLPIVAFEDDEFLSSYTWSLQREGCNPQTVKSYLRGYRVLAYFAMEQGYIDTKKIVIADTEAPIKSCYTDSEITRLLAEPDRDNFYEYRSWVIINFLISTGCRVSTLVDMNIGDIDFEETMINMNRQKNKHPTRLPMVRKLAKILAEYIDEYLSEQDAQDALFPRNDGSRATEDSIKKAIATYNANRKVSKTSIHLFRHTFAKNWILNGGDLLTLQKMLNHKSLKMVQHYANLYGQDIKPQAEQFSLINKVEGSKTHKRLERKKR